MTQSDQIRDDLSFVRGVVARRGESPVIPAMYYIWAVYVFVGYTLLDVNVRWANWFFLLAWFPAGAACGIVRRHSVQKLGERDDAANQKRRMHFMVGSLLAVGGVIGLACCVPTFRGPVTGQVMVVMFGLIYFLAGVHIDGSFLWLGPVLIVGGIVVGLVPHYGWTALGVVIAGGLCAAAVLAARRQRAQDSDSASTEASA
jgi:hypothetical protein